MYPVKYDILNGINLYHIEDKKYKTVSVTLFMHRKLERSEVTKNALITNVLKRGTSPLKNMREISIELDDLYGATYDVTVTKNGDVQSILGTINYLSKQYADKSIETKCTDLLIDFIFNPLTENKAFKKEYVESEKINLKDEIESIVNDKKAYADYRCQQEMFKGQKEEMRSIGFSEDLDEINEVNLYEHYKNIITSSPIDIFVVGDADIELIVSHFKKRFSEFEFNISPVYVQTEIAPSKDVKTITDKMDVNQGKLAIGLKTQIRANDELYYPLVVGNSIFGSGAHSKLFNNVREKLSLCYYAVSRVNALTGSMTISSGIEFKNFEKAKDEIFVQLDAVKNGDFTESELQIAKDYIINANIASKDSPLSLKVFYMKNIISKRNISIDDANKKIASVTKEDVVRAFKNITPDTIYFLKGLNE